MRHRFDSINPSGLIHNSPHLALLLPSPIIKRFMQEQGKLHHLGMARAELFRTFCLPTMVHQTNQNFLWIIRTDPDLDVDVSQFMIDLLRPYPHFLFVSSLDNPFGNWRRVNTTSDHVFNATKILSGDIELAYKYHELAQTLIVLETRLDADDGLHIDFINYVQTASKRLSKSEISTRNQLPNQVISNPTVTTANDNSSLVKRTIPEMSLLCFCVQEHYEWHYDGPSPSGDLLSRVENYCVTPGITIARSSDFHRNPKAIQHDRLALYIKECIGPYDTECLIWTRNLVPAAIRTRTPTSAGMRYVGWNKDQGEMNTTVNLEESAESKWSKLIQATHVSKVDAAHTKEYLQLHVAEIAEENLKGQCTLGHSCKETSKAQLLQLLDEAQNHSSVASQEKATVVS